MGGADDWLPRRVEGLDQVCGGTVGGLCVDVLRLLEYSAWGKRTGHIASGKRATQIGGNFGQLSCVIIWLLGSLLV